MVHWNELPDPVGKACCYQLQDPAQGDPVQLTYNSTAILFYTISTLFVPSNYLQLIKCILMEWPSLCYLATFDGEREREKT